MVKLGDKVQDIISGFKGIVTGKAEYLNGCVSFLVEGEVDKDGKTVNHWFDEQRLHVMGAGAFKAEAASATALRDELEAQTAQSLTTWVADKMLKMGWLPPEDAEALPERIRRIEHGASDV